MSEDPGAERVPAGETERPASTGRDDQIVGDDESGYGGAGALDEESGPEVRPESGHNRPPSEQDEDQGI